MHPIPNAAKNLFESRNLAYLLLIGLLAPLALVPYSDVPMPSLQTAAVVLVALLNLAVVPAAWCHGEGRSGSVFGTTMLLMPSAIVGNTAWAIFQVGNSYAEVVARGDETGCGMVAILIFMVPVITAVYFIFVAVILAAAGTIGGPKSRRSPPERV